MNKKTLFITLSSLAVLGAGVGTYLLLKRRKIRNLSNKDKIKLVYKSLQEDKDFGVSPIREGKNYTSRQIRDDEFFHVIKYIKDFEIATEYEGIEFHLPYININSNENFPDKLLINFEQMGLDGASFNGFIDLGLNTTITLIFYKEYQRSYEKSNKNDELFRKKFSGRNLAVALKKVLKYLCSDKVYKAYEKYNIKWDKDFDDYYKFCQKLK